MHKKTLSKVLEDHLAQRPEDTREFMDICVKSMDSWMNKVKTENDQQALRALRDSTMLRDCGLKPDIRHVIPLLLDSNFIVFRSGWGILTSGDAPSIQNQFIQFVKDFITYGILEHVAGGKIMEGSCRRWLNTRGGIEMIEWVESIFCVPDLQERLSRPSK